MICIFNILTGFKPASAHSVVVKEFARLDDSENFPQIRIATLTDQSGNPVTPTDIHGPVPMATVKLSRSPLWVGFYESKSLNESFQIPIKNMSVRTPTRTTEAVIQFVMAHPQGGPITFYLKTLSGKLCQQTIVYDSTMPMDWVQLPINQFKCADDLLISDEITEVGFAADTQTPLDFSFSSIEFASRPLAAASVEDIALEQIYFPRGQEEKMASVAKGLGAFFRSARSPENQQYAKSVILKGQKYIEAELAKYDFYLTPIIDQFNRLRSAELTEKISLPELLTLVNQHRLPFETGPFAHIHGRWSHQAQFLSGLAELDKEERDGFMYYIDHLLLNIGANWKTWSLFFDTRDHSIHSNRFWRDLLIGNGDCESLLGTKAPTLK